jgi:S1-C subfamily serine protease
MNLLDAIIVVVAIMAAVGGYRLGFVTRVVSWIGMGVGLAVAIKVLPAVLDRFRGADQLVLLALTLAVVFAGAFTGQAIGFVIGNRLRPRSEGGSVRRIDGAAGAVAGVLGVVVLVWLLLPVLAGASGYPSELATGSRVAQELDDHLPDAPDSIQALRSLFGEDNFPAVFDALSPTPDLGPPPVETGISAETGARVARSVVKVEGIACRQVQDGTGWVAGEDLVVTNAHVVAGERETEVIRDDGSRADATVVAFDPDRDLAVLRVPGLDRDPLAIAPSSAESAGGVYGHPGGGPLRIAPFAVSRRINAVGRDIYGTGVTTRDVLELRASLRPGDSGSALVSPAGTVVGVAFAIAPDRADVAYALATDELQAVLSGDLVRAVDTGPCTGTA